MRFDTEQSTPRSESVSISRSIASLTSLSVDAGSPLSSPTPSPCASPESTATVTTYSTSGNMPPHAPLVPFSSSMSPPTPKRSPSSKASFSAPPESHLARLERFVIFSILWMVRFLIDGLAYRIQRVFEFCIRQTYRRGLKISHHHYGTGWKEVVDVIVRSDTSVRDNTLPAVVYVHGGGWMIVSKDLMRPYITYMARKGGYRVFNADYPLSPEAQFPTALISVLRLLHWIKETYGVDRVILMGDSAGANMSVMISMLLSNKEFLQKLSTEAKIPDIVHWSFPTITRNVFFYGLFDEDTLSGPGVAPFLCRQVLRLHRHHEIFDGKCTPADFFEYLNSKFPRTCIVTGNLDPLYPGNVRFFETLKSLGVEATLEVFHGQTHGFHSFFWNMRRYNAQTFVLDHLRS